MIKSLHSDQATEFAAALRAIIDGSVEAGALVLRYSLEQSWLPESPRVPLLALLAADKGDVALSLAAFDGELLAEIEQLDPDLNALRLWCADRGLPWFDLGAAMRLETVAIPKPWGQELWYTGVEARGESRLVDAAGRSVPLSWLLGLRPELLLGQQEASLVLLKILDPLPEPVIGDLYFEMHEEKQEVYVVSHVDSAAWPDGVGGIRFGFDQDRRRASGSDEAFKRDYLAAVKAYRAVRTEIDDQLDQLRLEHGLELNAALEAEVVKDWLAQVPAPLREREEALREQMEAFIHTDPLRVGDVVKVPCFTPHSLLHGVRTVEFQTPVYERKILSFAQKVLTQSHWDTEAAIEQVNLDAPAPAHLPVIQEDERARWELVARFDDFEVLRLGIAAGGEQQIDTKGSYLLLMVIDGELRAGDHILCKEEAFLLPASAARIRLQSVPDRPAIVLLARPLQPV